MKLGQVRASRLAAAALVLGFVLLLVGCGSLGGDQNTFAPKGEVAGKQRDLFVLVLIFAVPIMIAVFAALGYVLIRFRRRSDDDPMPKQIHGNTRLEIGWTVAPMILLLGLAVPTILGIVELGRTPKNAVHVRVVASQWNWSFEYLDPEFDQAGEPFATGVCPTTVDSLACMYVPVGRDIDLEIESRDVNHSFWIPKIAGKTDAIAGHTNKMWLKADEAGAFHGQCAEFCGIGHPIMKLALVALEPSQFTSCMQELMNDNDEADVCNPPADG